jgi:hypothetical protein
MAVIKYRSFDPRLRPRRTKLDVPGWAGQPEPRANGSHEYPWHCIPFSEAARAGLELLYPHETELRVTTTNGIPCFQAEGEPPPFRAFGREYYTYQSLIDLRPEPGFAMKVETHPRFYSDTTGTVPVAVPAMLRHWWPMINFLVFKSPPEGQAHVFRPNEPFVQFTLVQEDTKIDLVEMTAGEAAERELQSRRIHASRPTLSAGTEWVSDTDTVFDGTYRRIYGAAKSTKGGESTDQ